MLAGKAAVRRGPRGGGDERRGKSGDSISCQIIVGTPVTPVILSASISSSARSGDQRCMKTILPPLARPSALIRLLAEIADQGEADIK